MFNLISIMDPFPNKNTEYLKTVLTKIESDTFFNLSFLVLESLTVGLVCRSYSVDFTIHPSSTS